MTIKISEARYIDGDVNKVIRATDIQTREMYREKYKGKLFCAEPGCHARLHHLDMRMNGGSMYFRTNGGNNPHKKDCPSEVKYRGTTTYVTGNGEAVEVPDEHIKETMERRRKLHADLLSGKKKSTSSRESKHTGGKRNPPPKPEKGEGKPVQPSLNGGGRKGSADEKGTRLIGRFSSQITKRDFTKPRCVDGYINQVLIYDDYAQIRFRDKGEYDVFIELGESFKENNISAFNSLKYLQKYLEKNKSVYSVCVGLVTERTDKVVIEIYKEIEFEIEGRTLTQLIVNNM